MLRRTIAIIAAGAAGAGIGVATYASLDGGGGSSSATSTPAASAPAPSPASAKSTLSVSEIYRRVRDGVVEVDVTTSSGSSSLPFGGQSTQEAEGSGFA